MGTKTITLKKQVIAEVELSVTDVQRFIERCTDPHDMVCIARSIYDHMAVQDVADVENACGFLISDDKRFLAKLKGFIAEAGQPDLSEQAHTQGT